MIGALLDRHPKVANWLYGFTPPERGLVVLVHRRVYIVPTHLGYLFGMTLLSLLVGSINYAHSLGSALPSHLSGIALADFVHTARNVVRMLVNMGQALRGLTGQ